MPPCLRLYFAATLYFRRRAFAPMARYFFFFADAAAAFFLHAILFARLSMAYADDACIRFAMRDAEFRCTPPCAMLRRC